MTSYAKPTERPDGITYTGFDHCNFYVSNAKQVADWYCLRFGFTAVAYKGLETGSRDIASWVVKQNDVFLVFTSALNPQANDINARVAVTGDACKDIAFAVSDARTLYAKAIERGAKSVSEPVEEKDQYGSIVRACVQTYGDTTHTFIQRQDYKGVFLPGFKSIDAVDPLATLLPTPDLRFIDHIVGNQPDNKMVEACDYYEKCLGFHRFWSVDDKQMHTQYSALRSIVMTDFDEVIKMPINEPAPGVRKSQIQEYVDYHGGAGVQHIALNTPDIIAAIRNLRKRGVSFLNVPDTYYEDLRKRLEKSPVVIEEDLKIIQELNILVDFDDQGYLLQLFTKPVEDRPTLFYEIIQRHNHSGFGAGNFKSLFEAIERDQAERGNL
jgi:4-hydroxyphenylpyruvate dioxygenase